MVTVVSTGLVFLWFCEGCLGLHLAAWAEACKGLGLAPRTLGDPLSSGHLFFSKEGQQPWQTWCVCPLELTPRSQSSKPHRTGYL